MSERPYDRRYNGAKAPQTRVRFNLPRVKTYAEMLPSVLRQPPKHRTRIAACPPKKPMLCTGGPFDGSILFLSNETLGFGRAATLPIRMRDGRQGVYIYGPVIGNARLKWQPTA